MSGGRVTRAAVYIIALLASGCAGSTTYNSLLETNGQARIERSRTADHDFDVMVKNVRDIGYNPENRPERDAVALSMAQSNCPHGARVTGEDVITTGTYLLGNPSREYTVQVACNP